MEARARAFNVPISKKYSIELARTIKGKNFNKALKFIEGVIKQKVPVRLTKYNRGVPHKKGIGPGKYPVKVAKAVKKLLLNAKNNAEQLGIDLDNAKVYLSANKGQSLPHGGRKIGTKRKATHLTVIIKGSSKKFEEENKVEKKEVVENQENKESGKKED